MAKRWERAIGTKHDNDGVARCGLCLERTTKAWTDGEIVVCDDCLWIVKYNVNEGSPGDAV